MRLLAIVITIACVSAGCTRLVEGAAVANPEPPQDVWQLIERSVSLVPLSVAKMETLLGTPMVENPQTPGRYEGGAVRLSPSLQVPSSVIGVKDGAWTLAGFDIEPQPCITIDMIKAHYPSVKLKYGVTGHSVYEEFGWVVSYDWGELGFGIRVKDDCLTGFGLGPANAPHP